MPRNPKERQNNPMKPKQKKAQKYKSPERQLGRAFPKHGKLETERMPNIKSNKGKKSWEKQGG